MWGVTWANIQLMMADAMRIDYKTEGKKGEKPEDEILDLNDPRAYAKLKAMAGA